MSALVEKLSTLVQQQLPEFVRADYPTFVAFLKAYYEFLEQSKGAQEVIQNARSYHDIDTTIDSFVEHFKKQYAIDIPESVLADKKLLYKNIRDLYQAKGTEKGFELLFQILFNENISFFYPAESMLRLSDGKWTTDTSIKIINVFGDPLILGGATLASTNKDAEGKFASAAIERVSRYFDGDTEIHELFLNRDSMSLTKFASGEVVSATLGSLQVTGIISAVVESVTIENAGTGYTVGDRLVFHGGSGVNAAGYISAVKSDGGILKLTITNFGSRYTVAPTGISVSTTTGSGAVLTAGNGPIADYTGYYIGGDGHLSELAKLQDGHFYQAFSYVIRVGQSINIWRDVVKKIMHPAGFALFGEVVITSSADVRMEIIPRYLQLIRSIVLKTNVEIRTTTFRPTLILTTQPAEDGLYPNSPVLVTKASPREFLPVLVLPKHERYITVADVRAAHFELPKTLIRYLIGPVDLTAELPSSIERDIVKSRTTRIPYGFGTNYDLIEKYKFLYSPNKAGDKGYFGPTAGNILPATTTIKDFADWVIGDFVNTPNKKQNYCVDAHVTSTIWSRSYRLPETVAKLQNNLNINLSANATSSSDHNIVINLHSAVQSGVLLKHARPTLIFETQLGENKLRPVQAAKASPREFLPVLVLPKPIPAQYITIADVRAATELRTALTVSLLGPVDLTAELPNNIDRGFILSRTSRAPYGFGTNYDLIEKYKFMYSPSEAGDKGYFGSTAAKTLPSTTMIKDFAEYVIADFVNATNKKQNYCVDAHITLISP